MRDWLDRYLEAKETPQIAESPGASPEALAAGGPGSSESPAQSEQGAFRPDTQLFEVGGGPPAHWLERVRAGAPQLLLHPDEGGTPWFVAGRPTPVPLVNLPRSMVPDAGAGDAKAGKADEEITEAKRIESAKGYEASRHQESPQKKSQVNVERPLSTERGSPDKSRTGLTKPSAGDHLPLASPLKVSSTETRETGDRGKRYSRPAESVPDSTRDSASRFTARQESARGKREATDSPSQKELNSKPDAPPDRTKQIPDASKAVSARTPAAHLPLAPEVVWPEFQEPSVTPSQFAFGHSLHRSPAPSPFPEVSRSDSAAYRAQELPPVRSKPGDNFARVQLPIAGRQAGYRGAGTISAEAQPTENVRDLWPDLPSAPELAALELERTMRHWERTMRLDREQRGEF